MSDTPNFKDQMLECIPSLRAFARSLASSADAADDLVQETLVKAWHKQDSFHMGTNIRAWMFTILRNEFYSQMRKRGREISDANGALSENMAVHPEQSGKMDLQDMQKALNSLPEDQREAIILIGASGMSYEEAAEVCGVAVGTIKSRVSRARTRLAEVLEIGNADDYGPDAVATQIMAMPALSRQ